VLYFQVTDARAAAYEIASFLQASKQSRSPPLRNVVGSMDLARTLPHETPSTATKRRADDATGKWGCGVNRVEIRLATRRNP